MLMLQHERCRILGTKCLAHMLLLRYEGALQFVGIVDYGAGILTLDALRSAWQLLIYRLLVWRLVVERLLQVGMLSIAQETHLKGGRNIAIDVDLVVRVHV